jgi:hypothetical protein
MAWYNKLVATAGIINAKLVKPLGGYTVGGEQ